MNSFDDFDLPDLRVWSLTTLGVGLVVVFALLAAGWPGFSVAAGDQPSAVAAPFRAN